MDSIDELISWATAKGVKLDGIKPARMPGRGVGIVATRQIAPGEILLEVPTPCLRTTDTVSKVLERKLPRTISVHGLLAADLAADLLNLDQQSTDQAPWDAVCPTPADFITMPLLWPASLQALLPSAARELLAKQQAKFARDWEDAGVAFPPEPRAGARSGEKEEDDDDDEDEDDDDHDDGNYNDNGAERLSLESHYRYAWLLVNTRTFYWYTAAAAAASSNHKGRPKRRKVQPTDADSCMCLQPVADLFNHGDDEGCNVAFDDEGYTVKALRAFAADDEVRISYGRHSGDFLLVEYGFVMDVGNRWDEVALDDVLLPRFSARQRELLDEVGFLGRYVLDCNKGSDEVVCYRTQVAVRLLCCGRGVSEWRKFVDGVDDGEASRAKVDKVLEEVLVEYKGVAEKRIKEVEGLKGIGAPAQRDVLVKRWRQIRDLLAANIARLRESDGVSE